MMQCITKRPLFLWNWNLKIKSCIEDGFFSETLKIYSSMLNSGLNGDNFTFPLVLKACAKLGSVKAGKVLHAHSLQLGFQQNLFVQTALVDMYSKCSCSAASRQLFDEMSERSLVSWNSMISAYCKDFDIENAFELLKEMLVSGLEPSSSTFVSILSGCCGKSGLGAFRQGLSIHCYGVKLGLVSDLLLSNSIMCMYVHFHRLDAARTFFSSMQEKSIVSWTVMIGGYVNIGDVGEAFNVFNKMREEDVCLDSVVLLNLVSGCGHIGRLLISTMVHALIVKTGCDQGDSVENSLVSMYVKCGDLISARRIFDLVNKKNVILWTSIISGYAQLGNPVEALHLFRCFLRMPIKPNEVTLTIVLSACADLGSLTLGAEVEDYIKMNGFDSDLWIQTSLIHMYCKCGSTERAREIFDRASIKDLHMWSSMINGYAMNGFGEEALALFYYLQRQEGFKPDAVVYTGVLSACSHSGLVEDGLKYFRSMQREFGVKPSIEHYSLLVDLLGRAGQLDLALKTIEEMPVHAQAQALVPLLSACRTHGNIELGEYVAKKSFDVGPQNTSNFILMGNIYASQGKWKEAAAMRKMMGGRGLVKEPGWSQIEVHGSFHVFLVGDRSHYQSVEIYEKLNELNSKLGEAGYVA